MNNVNFYNVFAKMFIDFERTFEIKNETNKKINKLFNNFFHQNFKNKNEIFDEFMIRFNILIVFLKLKNNILINQFKKKIKSTFNYKMWIFENIENWKQFITKCRNVCNDLKHIDKYKIDKIVIFIIKIIRIQRFNRFKKFKSNKLQNDIKFYVVKKNFTRRTTRLSNYIIERFRKKQKCFKYFKKNYIAKNKNAFYKNEKFASKNILFIVFVAINIKWNELKKINRQNERRRFEFIFEKRISNEKLKIFETNRIEKFFKKTRKKIKQLKRSFDLHFFIVTFCFYWKNHEWLSFYCSESRYFYNIHEVKTQKVCECQDANFNKNALILLSSNYINWFFDYFSAKIVLFNIFSQHSSVSSAQYFNESIWNFRASSFSDACLEVSSTTWLFRRCDFFNDALFETFEQTFSTWWNHASMRRLQKRTNRNSMTHWLQIWRKVEL